MLRRDRENGVTNCPICNVLLDYEVSRQPNSAEPDHIVPTARGGTDHASNGRTICRLCNQRRGAGQDPKPAEPVGGLIDW